MGPLDRALDNGEIVEILTTKAPHGRSRDWLTFVKSASARDRIRKWFKSQRREENVAKGRDLLEKELHRMHRVTLGQLPDGKLDEMAAHYKYASGEDFLAAIGYGDVAPHPVVSRMALPRADHGAQLPPLPLTPQPRPAP